ncbi:hypothetical protein C0J52_07489 [Blattella germanica]|nr:hypothetical protein C0J52_07489 [Blattella germanica]
MISSTNINVMILCCQFPAPSGCAVCIRLPTAVMFDFELRILMMLETILKQNCHRKTFRVTNFLLSFLWSGGHMHIKLPDFVHVAEKMSHEEIIPVSAGIKLPRTHEYKGILGKLKPDDMVAAIREVKENKMPLATAAKRVLINTLNSQGTNWRSIKLANCKGNYTKYCYEGATNNSETGCSAVMPPVKNHVRGKGLTSGEKVLEFLQNCIKRQS